MITVENLATQYESLIPHRDRRLFTVFLLKGYRQTTLSSVRPSLLGDVVYAKVCLGMLITLFDDLADNPALANPDLLKHLYQLNIDKNVEAPLLNKHDTAIYDLAVHLLNELNESIKSFPHYQKLKNILAFDLQQFYLANQYAEIVTQNSQVRNLLETKVHGAYNMGIVAAGTIDLMASDDFDFNDLGHARESFIIGQRVGRIGNIIHTFTREQNENDITNEMLLDPKGVENYRAQLLQELENGFLHLSEKSKQLQSLQLDSYTQGLRQLYQLHMSMEGII